VSSSALCFVVLLRAVSLTGRVPRQIHLLAEQEQLHGWQAHAEHPSLE